MTDLLFNIGPGELIPLASIVAGLVFLLSPIIAICWYKIHKTNTTAALKQDMLNRGMSAEEIETILEAGSKSFWKK